MGGGYPCSSCENHLSLLLGPPAGNMATCCSPVTCPAIRWTWALLTNLWGKPLRGPVWIRGSIFIQSALSKRAWRAMSYKMAAGLTVKCVCVCVCEGWSWTPQPLQILSSTVQGTLYTSLPSVCCNTEYFTHSQCRVQINQRLTIDSKYKNYSSLSLLIKLWKELDRFPELLWAWNDSHCCCFLPTPSPVMCQDTGQQEQHQWGTSGIRTLEMCSYQHSLCAESQQRLVPPTRLALTCLCSQWMVYQATDTGNFPLGTDWVRISLGVWAMWQHKWWEDAWAWVTRRSEIRL